MHKDLNLVMKYKPLLKILLQQFLLLRKNVREKFCTSLNTRYRICIQRLKYKKLIEFKRAYRN